MEAAKKMDKNNVRIEKVIQTVIALLDEDVFGGGGDGTTTGDGCGWSGNGSDWTPWDSVWTRSGQQLIPMEENAIFSL